MKPLTYYDEMSEFTPEQINSLPKRQMPDSLMQKFIGVDMAAIDSPETTNVVMIERFRDEISGAVGISTRKLFSVNIKHEKCGVDMNKTVIWSGKRYGKSYAMERHFRYGLLARIAKLFKNNKRGRNALKSFKMLYGY